MFTKCLLIIALLTASIGCQNAASVENGPDAAALPSEVSPKQAEAAVSKAYSQFIDVRTPEEYSGGHAARAVNIPLDDIAKSSFRMEKNEPVYLICESGSRSTKAAAVLKEAGFKNVASISGGTAAWRSAGLPMETRPPHSPANN